MLQEVVEEIEKTVKDVLNNSVHTAMPGKILAFYEDTAMVDVQPIGSFYCGKIEMDYPVIPSIPICITANSFGIASCIPVKPGDLCLLVCAEQSLSAFVSGTSEAQSNERFELTNCIAIPGLVRAPVEAQQIANEKDAIVVTNKGTQVIVTEDEIQIKADKSKIECDVDITGNVSLTGEFTAEGNVSLSGNVSIKGDLFVDGNIKATGDIDGANTGGEE